MPSGGRDPAGPVALVGYMGSGKSTVGRELSRLLGRDFVDLDHEIERRARKTIPEIFAERGETGFRELESECLADETRHPERVVSCGGGIVIRAENRAILKSMQTVFIREDLDILFDRTRSANRPLRGGDRREFEERFRQREPHYVEVADLTVTVAGRHQHEVAKEVAAWLGR